MAYLNNTFVLLKTITNSDMMKKDLILEAGADGGSIKLLLINGSFIYTTDETTLREDAPEMPLEAFKSKSDVFPTFDLAMMSLLGKYSIFGLYPLQVHPDFKEKIVPYYQMFCKINGMHENWNKEYWEQLLFGEIKF